MELDGEAKSKFGVWKGERFEEKRRKKVRKDRLSD